MSKSNYCMVPCILLPVQTGKRASDILPACAIVNFEGPIRMR